MKRHAQLAAILLCFWVQSTGCGRSPVPEAPQSFEEFRLLLESRIESSLKKHRIPGAALALVHEGAVVVERGFGVLRRGDAAPVESSTVFQVASVSKPVTAVAVLQLAEEGVLGEYKGSQARELTMSLEEWVALNPDARESEDEAEM